MANYNNSFEENDFGEGNHQNSLPESVRVSILEHIKAFNHIIEWEKIVGKDNIIKWNKGERNPNLRHCIDIANAMNISMDCLINDTRIEDKFAEDMEVYMLQLQDESNKMDAIINSMRERINSFRFRDTTELSFR